MSLEILAEHIKNKVKRCNPNNPKSNWGARLIKQNGGQDLIDDFMFSAVEIIELLFEYNNEKRDAGSASLTMASMSIGEMVLSGMGVEGDKKKKAYLIDQIRTGDLFVEALVKQGYVYLEPPVTFNTCYTIHADDKWTEIGRSLLEYDESKLWGTHKTPVTDGVLIKGEETKRSQETVWCRSAMKLMQVPWTINKPVYEALVASKDMFVSEEPIKVVDSYTKKLEQRRRSKCVEMHFDIIKTEVMARMEKFYVEVELDYRGRVYVKEPFSNFQGSDWSRGTMMFHEGKEMTPEGEYWLAVHTASCYNESYDIDELPDWTEADYHSHLKSEGLDSISVDKFTLDDRVRWFNENKDWICDAGRDKTIYPNCEKPISFLAACIEWHKLLDLGITVSHLPVSIDGSNNGWQHLGAMSKDTRTGKLVGLVAQEIQQDFYVTTAKQLMEIDDPKLNAMPMKHIRKGVSKRGSMTRAYSAGAGKIGENMWFDVRSAEFDIKYGITEKDCKRWANELIKAINVVCPGPLRTMEYLQELASFEIGTYKKYRDGEYAGPEFFKLRKELNDLWQEEDKDMDRIDQLIEEVRQFYSVLVRGNGKKAIRWKTPSNFPVKYECFRQEDFKCRGTINGKQVKHSIKVNTDIPDVRGFMCGISPNFVHSMDASHMALVIDRWDQSFGAIHDSFSTHACDVEDLLALTKQTFVDMYNVDNFYDYMTDEILTDPEGFNIDQPDRGTLDVSGVYDSDYFFA